MRELTLLKIIQKTFNLSHVAENQPDDYKKTSGSKVSPVVTKNFNSWKKTKKHFE